MQSRNVASAPVRLHHDLDILIERYEEAQEALNRKLPKFAAQHLGDVRLFDAETRGSLDLFQATLFWFPSHSRAQFIGAEAMMRLRAWKEPHERRNPPAFNHDP
jgi:hypothetical protein